MANYNDDDLDDELDGDETDEVIEEGAVQPAGNRNFMMALGILGGIFLLLVIALAVVALTRPRQPAAPGVNIAATNAVISTTSPTVTRTSVLVATNTAVGGTGGTPLGGSAAGGALTPTVTGAAVGQIDTRTATVAALLTQRAQTLVAGTQVKLGTVTNTPVKAISGTPGAGTPGVGTPTKLPDTGFAEDIGLPGLFGMAFGMLALIVVVRRLRISTQS